MFTDSETHGRPGAIARQMLALGVRIAAFETEFGEVDGAVEAGFHAEWEDAIERWWLLLEAYEAQPETLRSEQAETMVAAAKARMFRLPDGPGSGQPLQLAWP